ncbi:unannotated protein [freshwater metagenome]|uniref:Unannotated protein n=1 Tax=freshwater metagenome TaxID=449393 RepID=A0A6J6X711_9ZZZZ
MIGSDTFIMVALRCSENSTPCALASATCSARNFTSAFLLMKVPSMISPACRDNLALSTVTLPSVATSSMRTSVAVGTVTDFSLPKKSPPVMVLTWVLESADHLPIECGCLRA